MIKIDQIAFGTYIKALWHKRAASAEATDEVTFSGRFRRGPDWMSVERQIGWLAFRYNHGIEIEHLCYPEPLLTFHRFAPRIELWFLSHLGAHVASIDETLKENPEWEEKMIMDVITDHHTNPKIAGRHYRYVIIDRREHEGYFLKLIERRT